MRALVLAATLLLTPASASAQPLTRALAEITPPASVGPYARGARTDLGGEERGVAFQYASSADSSFATVYFYRPPALRAGTPAREVMAAEVEEFKQFIQAQEARGVYERAEVAYEEANDIRAGSTPVPGYKLAFVYRNGGAYFVSLLNLYVAGETVVKVRGTVPAEQFENTRLPGFADVVTAQSVLSN